MQTKIDENKAWPSMYITEVEPKLRIDRLAPIWKSYVSNYISDIEAASCIILSVDLNTNPDRPTNTVDNDLQKR